jgi:hypothetical protein
MNKKLTGLVGRREQLVLLVTAQRIALAQHVQPLRAPLAMADRGWAVLRYVKGHPGLSIAASLLVAVLPPKRASSWVIRGWVMWQFGRKLLRR